MSPGKPPKAPGKPGCLVNLILFGGLLGLVGGIGFVIYTLVIDKDWPTEDAEKKAAAEPLS